LPVPRLGLLRWTERERLPRRQDQARQRHRQRQRRPGRDPTPRETARGSGLPDGSGRSP
jgi:hypothetical protein